jgi:hypothetical protein
MRGNGSPIQIVTAARLGPDHQRDGFIFLKRLYVLRNGWSGQSGHGNHEQAAQYRAAHQFLHFKRPSANKFQLEDETFISLCRSLQIQDGSK